MSDTRTSEERFADLKRVAEQCPDTEAHVYATEISRALLREGLCPDPDLHKLRTSNPVWSNVAAALRELYGVERPQHLGCAQIGLAAAAEIERLRAQLNDALAEIRRLNTPRAADVASRVQWRGFDLASGPDAMAWYCTEHGPCESARCEKCAASVATARPCTCHPDDNPPRPCPQKYALDECRRAADGASEDRK